MTSKVTAVYLPYLLGITSDCICLAACATGMFTGLHATLVFSLMTVYGRTAVGCGWDESFRQFFQATEQVRFRGFRSFRVSLYTFLVQILFIIVSRLPPRTKNMGTIVLSYAAWRIYRDTQSINNKAGAMLFAGRQHLSTGEAAALATQKRQAACCPQRNQLVHCDDGAGDSPSP